MPPYAARQSMGRAAKPLFVSGLLRIGAVQAEDAETTDKTAYPAPAAANALVSGLGSTLPT